MGAGVAFTSASALSLPPVDMATWSLIVVVTSLWPDLDGKGKLTRFLPPLTTFMSFLTRKLAGWFYRKTQTPLDYREARIHRGLSHTPLYILGTSVLLYLALLPTNADAFFLASAFLVGNLAHLLGDFASLSGLPLLWPVKVQGKRWYDVKVPSPLRFRVGGEVERNILTPIMFFMAFGALILYVYTYVKG